MCGPEAVDRPVTQLHGRPSPPRPGGGTLNPDAATAVLVADAIVLLAVAARLVLRRDVP